MGRDLDYEAPQRERAAKRRAKIKAAREKLLPAGFDMDDLLADLKSRDLRFIDGDGDEHDDDHVLSELRDAIIYQLHERDSDD